MRVELSIKCECGNESYFDLKPDEDNVITLWQILNDYNFKSKPSTEWTDVQCKKCGSTIEIS
ncbi:hypothetical protein D1872_251670 [compost metagenome]